MLSCAQFIALWLPQWMLRHLYYKMVPEFLMAAFPGEKTLGDFDILFLVKDANERNITWRVVAYFALTGRIEIKPFGGPISIEYIDGATFTTMAGQDVVTVAPVAMRPLGSSLAADAKSDMADRVLETSPINSVPIHKYYRRLVDD